MIAPVASYYMVSYLGPHCVVASSYAAMLKAAVRICLHMVALKLKTAMDSDGPRNTVCGPWHHHP